MTNRVVVRVDSVYINIQKEGAAFPSALMTEAGSINGASRPPFSNYSKQDASRRVRVNKDRTIIAI